MILKTFLQRWKTSNFQAGYEWAAGQLLTGAQYPEDVGLEGGNNEFQRGAQAAYADWTRRVLNVRARYADLRRALKQANDLHDKLNGETK